MSEGLAGANGALNLSESAPVLDALDQRLLSSLDRNGRAGFGDLGEEVGLSRDAVRARLQRLQSDGIITVTGTPDPAALGYHSAALIGVNISGPVQETAPAIAAAPEVSFAVCTFGGFDVLVEVLARDDEHLLEVVDQRIRSVSGVVRCTVMLFVDVFKWVPAGLGPLQSMDGEAPRTLDDGDRALARALQLDGRATYQDLAESTGLSYANARNKTKALLESGAVRIITVVNRFAARSAAMAAVAVRVSAPVREVAEALVEIDEVEVLIQIAGTNDLILELVSSDRVQLNSCITDRIHTTPGVAATETFVYAQILRLPVQWGSDALGDAVSMRR